MEKEFVTYEIALKLKELGFDEPCCALFRHERLFPILGFEIINSIKQSVIAAPLWQQVISWLKNECKLEIEVFKWVAKCYHNEELATPHYLFDIDKAFEYTNDWIYQSINDDLKYHTYEEAREQAILKAIELIKNK